MSGPADYMRITGPLGGANFLSASEYDAINPGSPGNRVISTMQQGANLAGTVASNKSRELENQAKQIEIDDTVQKKTDQGAIIDVLVDARNARTAAPAEAIPMQQPQAATPQIAPQVVPQVAQQAAPVAPAPAVAVPAPQGAQAAPVAAAPAPQAAASLPPTSAAPAPAAKGPLAQAQDFLARAAETESDYQKDIKRVQDRLGKGELTPRLAQLSLDTLRARRDAETARDTKYAENLDKLQTQFAEGKVTREEARLKLADLNRNQKYDLALMVSDDLAAAGPAQARQTAAENGLNPDEYINADGQPTAKLKTDADKSAEAKARAKVLEEKKKADDKVKADEKKANQVKWSFDKDTGLSTGVDPVTGASLIKDENGKAITTAEYRALDAKQRSAIAAAGASKTTVSVGGTDRGGEKMPVGAIPLKVKPEQQITATENRDIGLNTRESLSALQTLHNRIIARSGFNPKDSKFEVNFKNWWSSNMQNDPLIAEYNTIRQRVVNDVLRTNKGSQTDNDAIREADAQLKLGLPPSAHASMAARLGSYNERGIKRNESISRGYTMSGDSLPAGETVSNEFDKYKRGGGK